MSSERSRLTQGQKDMVAAVYAGVGVRIYIRPAGVRTVVAADGTELTAEIPASGRIVLFRRDGVTVGALALAAIDERLHDIDEQGRALVQRAHDPESPDEAPPAFWVNPADLKTLERLALIERQGVPEITPPGARSRPSGLAGLTAASFGIDRA
jgi:hypothetical protein